MKRSTGLASEQRRRVLRLALAGTALALLPACRDGASSEVASGDRFPNAVLPDLNGRPVSFAAYQAVPLLVNFWASWCPPCRHEMPGLEKLGAFFSANDLRVVGVTVDSDLYLAREFALLYKLTFPLLSDRTQAFSKGALRIPALPITYLLKRDRTIARIIVGERDWTDIRMLEEIEQALAIRRLAAAT